MENAKKIKGNFLRSDWSNVGMVIGGNKIKTFFPLSPSCIFEHQRYTEPRDKRGSNKWQNSISFSISRLKQIKKKSFELKTNRKSSFSSFSHRKKIKYRWKNHSQKKKERKEKREKRFFFFSSRRSSGWFRPYLKWENLFFISTSYLLRFIFSRFIETTKLLFLLQLMMSRGSLKCLLSA